MITVDQLDNWVNHIFFLIQQFIVVWAAVHAGNRTALKPMIEESERKVNGGLR